MLCSPYLSSLGPLLCKLHHWPLPSRRHSEITVILHFNRRKIPCRLFYKLEPLPMRQLTHHYYLCLSLPPQTRVIGVMTNLSLLKCSTGALILSLGQFSS